MQFRIRITALCLYKDPDGRTEEIDGIQDFIGITRSWAVEVPDDDFIALNEYLDNLDDEYWSYLDMDREAASDVEILACNTVPYYINYDQAELKAAHTIVQDCMKAQ